MIMLIKIPFIQYLYGIRSMRQTVKEIEVNVAYRWFLGLEMMNKVPHFSTFGLWSADPKRFVYSLSIPMVCYIFLLSAGHAEELRR